LAERTRFVGSLPPPEGLPAAAVAAGEVATDPGDSGAGPRGVVVVVAVPPPAAAALLLPPPPSLKPLFGGKVAGVSEGKEER